MDVDRAIQQQVLAVLEREPGVHADRIGVSVADGVVWLQGMVGTLTEKYLAERAAREVSFVRAVANDLDDGWQGVIARSDPTIAAAAANALEWDSAIPDCAVKATVTNGWVTLTGAVSGEHEWWAAERAVRHLSGIVGVSNTIVIDRS